MGKDYGKTPSEMLKVPIDVFLYDWKCTIELREKEFEENEKARSAARSGVVPPRLEYDRWKELVNEDIKKSKQAKKKKNRTNPGYWNKYQ
jgi:hypothetical protein